MSKTIFSQGTILTPEVANSWQNPTFVSRADFPVNTTQLDLNDGQFFVPSVSPADIVTTSTDTDDFLRSDGAGAIVTMQIWGGAIEEPAIGTVGPGGGVPVTVKGGTIVDTLGALQTFTDTVIEIINQTLWIYVDDNGVVQTAASEPPRQIPHTSLATITAVGSQITSNIDLRPHKYVGAHNDTPLELVNTPTQTADYQAVAFDRVIMDNTGGSWVVTLPLTPQDGDRVAIYDLFGQFNVNPGIVSRGTAGYTISGSTEDWIFSAPYTYIELVYLSDENTWAFRSIPDTTCKNRGVFIKCGGVVSTIGNQIDCENAGFQWTAATSQCFRFSHMATYSDGNGGSVIIHHDPRCAGDLDTELVGRFLRCDGTTAVYDAGSDMDTIDTKRVERLVENAQRCSGTTLGAFIECRVNTTVDQSGLVIYDGIYENGDGTGEIVVEGDDRCIPETDLDAKQGNFVQCMGAGAVNFGDQTVPVGVYTNNAGNYDYLFDDPRCRDISASDVGRFLKCDDTTGVYQLSEDGTSYRTIPFDKRCYNSDETGRITMFIRTEAQIGPWLKCDGGGYAAGTYPALDALLTSVYGLASGIKPDFRDRSPYGTSDGTLSTVFSGVNNYTLLEAQLPVHTHSATIPDHNHILSMAAHTHSVVSPPHAHSFTATDHSHTLTMSAHTHVFTPVTHNHTITGDGSHAHTINIGNHAHTLVVPNHIHDPGQHTHGIGAHRHTLYSWSAGLGEEADSVANANGAIAGEVNGPNAYLDVNGSGTPLVSSVGQQTFARNAPTSNAEMTFGAVTAWNDPTQPSGTTDAAGAVSTNTGLNVTTNAWDIEPADAGGTVESTTTTGTADLESVVGVTDNTEATINVTPTISTGTIQDSALTATIGTTGSSDSIDLRHALFHGNFYIHV